MERHDCEFTLATNQVDFAVLRRFGLVYRDKDNTDKTPLCIHCAPLGTHERFIGFLIEHYAGNFPLWLAPEQVRVMTIGEEEPLVNYAKAIVSELRANFVRRPMKQTVTIDYRPLHAYTMSNDIGYIEPKARVYRGRRRQLPHDADRSRPCR